MHSCYCLFLFVVACCAQYCSPGPTTTVDGNLGATALNGDSKSFSETSDCPGYIGARDLTYLWADIHPGGTYTLTYNVTTCGNWFPVLSGAWIDFDQNGSFDATEVLFPFNSSMGLIKATFVVAPTSPIRPGMTRMRVQVQETQASSLDPCTRFAYGGTKDFNISISGGSFNRCDSGPTTTFDGNLGAISLSGDSSSISDATTCPGVIGPIDLTAQSADLTPGNEYELHYDVITCGGYYPSLSTAWIDYNGNSKLEDWEQLAPYSSLFGSNIVKFYVPESQPDKNQEVVKGKVWMRVQMQETNAVSLDPCFKFPYGGTKDFTILLKAPYCSSGPSSLGGIQLGQVSLQGSTTGIFDNTGCPGGTGPQNFMNQSADLIQGQPWVLSYNVINCGNNAPFSSAAWIDFDEDGTFETWEQITPTSSATTNMFQFKVPPSTTDEKVLSGFTRMRVQVQANANPPLNPCNDFTIGGTKDFGIQVITNPTMSTLTAESGDE